MSDSLRFDMTAAMRRKNWDNFLAIFTKRALSSCIVYRPKYMGEIFGNGPPRSFVRLTDNGRKTNLQKWRDKWACIDERAGNMWERKSIDSLPTITTLINYNLIHLSYHSYFLSQARIYFSPPFLLFAFFIYHFASTLIAKLPVVWVVFLGIRHELEFTKWSHLFIEPILRSGSSILQRKSINIRTPMERNSDLIYNKEVWWW